MQLITRAQTGDREAFVALFDQYKNLVYRTAYLMLGDSSDAEDVLQEIFVQVYKSLSAFDPNRAAFTTWLHRVTFNYCLNHRRRKRFIALPFDEISPLFKTEFPGAQLAEGEAVQQAVQKLSDKQRAVVILRYFWDLSYAEIAQVLNVPLGTIKSRIDQSLKTLRQILEKQESLSGVSMEEEI